METRTGWCKKAKRGIRTSKHEIDVIRARLKAAEERLTMKEIEESTGNVFADLGIDDAEELDTKAQLAHRIGEIIRGRHLTQAEAADVLGATQPIVSKLMRGQLHGFSLERLVRFLNGSCPSSPWSQRRVTSWHHKGCGWWMSVLGVSM